MKPVWNPQLVYDHYFSSGTYTERYPSCNQRNLNIILSRLQASSHVLDFGCGEGRYTLPILQHTSALVTASDISSQAIAQLREKLNSCPPDWSDRLRLIEGDVYQIKEQSQLDLNFAEKFDVIIVMFGVLSHIAGQKTRIELLQTLRQMLRSDGNGAIIISVPNAYRRFFVEQIRHFLLPDRATLELIANEPGDIVYSRTFNNLKTYKMYYHLYTVSSLQQELQHAGFKVSKVMAESVFSESKITRSTAIHNLDQALTPFTPACLGYGILAIATPSD